MLIKKALHIVTDATDLIYYPFRTWGFILMVRDLLLEDYWDYASRALCQGSWGVV